MSTNFSLNSLIDRLIDSLEPVLGTVITNLVIGLIIREASIGLTDEQRSTLETNRATALAARADEVLRAADSASEEQN